MGLIGEMREDSEFKKNKSALIEMALGKMVPDHSKAILALLEQEPEKELFNLLNNYLSATRGSKVGLEDLPKIHNVVAHIHDPNGEPVTSIPIGTSSNDPTVHAVGDKTFEKLRDLAVDYDTLRKQAASQVDNKTAI